MSPENRQVFGPQVYGHQANYVHVGFTPFCMSEVRFLTSGKCVIAGVPFDRCPGETAADKRKAILHSTIDSLRVLIADGGFLMDLTDVGAIQIPSGYMVIFAATSNCIGIRWSTIGDERDTSRVAHVLGAFLESFPEVRNPSLGHLQMHEWLTSD
jgi:hypothetical protein